MAESKKLLYTLQRTHSTELSLKTKYYIRPCNYTVLLNQVEEVCNVFELFYIISVLLINIEYHITVSS